MYTYIYMYINNYINQYIHMYTYPLSCTSSGVFTLAQVQNWGAALDSNLCGPEEIARKQAGAVGPEGEYLSQAPKAQEFRRTLEFQTLTRLANSRLQTCCHCQHLGSLTASSKGVL